MSKNTRSVLPSGEGKTPWKTSPRARNRWHKAVAHLKKADLDLAALIDQVGPCLLDPVGMDDPFEALVETVVYQQLSGKAASTIFDRLAGLFGEGQTLTPSNLLSTTDERLRSVGLSRPKIKTMRDLANRVSDGSLRLDGLERRSDEDLAEELIKVHGIGPWSVQMILIFRLGRPDVWPVTDLGIRKGAQRTWRLPELPDERRLLPMGDLLRPYRSIAAWYLWRSLEL